MTFLLSYTRYMLGTWQVYTGWLVLWRWTWPHAASATSNNITGPCHYCNSFRFITLHILLLLMSVCAALFDTKNDGKPRFWNLALLWYHGGATVLQWSSITQAGTAAWHWHLRLSFKACPACQCQSRQWHVIRRRSPRPGGPCRGKCHGRGTQASTVTDHYRDHAMPLHDGSRKFSCPSRMTSIWNPEKVLTCQTRTWYICAGRVTVTGPGPRVALKLRCVCRH